MNKISVVDYFNDIGYDWQKDRQDLEHILELTKTRPKENPPEKYTPGAGTEQTFFMKAIASQIGAKKFFEVGTGRGTACYAISLLDSVEEIITVDIVSHYQKKNEAINSKPAVVSNADLYDMIKFDQKEKIKFKHTSEMPYILDEYEEEVDLAFIDGNHSDYNIVMQDYINCRKLLKPGGVLVFDDYHMSKFIVKKVVDDILKEDPDLDATLVCLKGHIFDTDHRTEESGMVLIKL